MIGNLPRHVGLVWFEPEHYDVMRRLMPDGMNFPASHYLWRLQAETREKELRRKGHVVVRVLIDPEAFPLWCQANGQNLDAQGRTLYAAHIAELQMGDPKGTNLH